MPPITPEVLLENPEILLERKCHSGQRKFLYDIGHNTCVNLKLAISCGYEGKNSSQIGCMAAGRSWVDVLKVTL